ncbi:unannotated protein [freshwater metagenome]|uniref:Unannotated protein n=1 Tax=freshwater metagenome TaxID=449393 RepID=A0A6J6HC66_9ZZZZ|nr:GNAT family N-acetyltransferase [Actinomycetota bacterium]
MTSEFSAPVLLTPTHNVAQFHSRSQEQNEWLVRHGVQSHRMGSTRSMVVCTQETSDVVAYYAWRMSEIDFDDAPPRLQVGSGKYEQPMALIARLAVSVEHEGKGIGAALLRDAITRLVMISAEIGCRGVCIVAADAQAKSFYQRVLPELIEAPSDPMMLVLLMKDARRTLLGE